MKKLNVVLSILIISMMISSLSFAGSFDSNIGMLKMSDKAYQLKKQAEYCYDALDTAEQVKQCYIDNAKAYALFMKYIEAEVDDDVMDACLFDALEEWWFEGDNSTLWYAVMEQSMNCYKQNQ